MSFALKDIRNLSPMGITESRVIRIVIGVGVMFACLGLGEAVYRLLFLDFDGATDRLPIELCFGLSFAYVTTKIVGKMYRNYQQTSTKMRFIRDRNDKIRRAIGALAPAPYPHNQQAIRVIREQVDRIDSELSEGRRD